MGRGVSHTERRMCLGLGPCEGDPAAPGATIRECSGIAEELHERTEWEAPPNPLHLAAEEGVRLYAQPEGEREIVLPDRGFFASAVHPDERGLWIAHALAGCLLLRRNMAIADRSMWLLAAELLAPAWIWRGPRVARHSWAPRWLLDMRRRAHLATSGGATRPEQT